MKRLFISLGALLALAMAAPNAMAQQRRGNGGAGHGRGSNGAGIQTRAGNQGRAAQWQQGNQSRQPSTLLSTKTSGADLLRMWEEEKLARDVYVSLAKTTKLTIFRNISSAENQHMRSLERLIPTGGANGNALNNAPGIFVFPEYQQLYESLIASGTRSPLDALTVGAKIEEMDIADLKRLSCKIA